MKLKLFLSKLLKSKFLAYFLILFILIAVGISLILMLNRDSGEVKQNDDTVTYKTVDEAIRSKIDPGKAKDIESYNSALELYRNDDYGAVTKSVEKMLEVKVDSEVEPGAYALLYNAYLKQDLLDQAKNTIEKFMLTSSYASLDTTVKAQWESQISELNKGIKPNPNPNGDNDVQ